MIRLLKSDFSVSANTPNVLTKVLQYIVPKAQVLVIRKGAPFKLYPVAKQIVTLGTGTSRTYYDVVVDYALADNPLFPASSPSLNRLAYATWLGNPAAITDITPATRTIRVTVNDSAGDIVVYYMPGLGVLEVDGEAPGISSVTKRFFEGDVGILNAGNHYKTTQAPKFGKDLVLPPDFALLVKMNAAYSVDFNAPNAYIEIEADLIPQEKFVQMAQKLIPAGMSLADTVIRAWAGE